MREENEGLNPRESLKTPAVTNLRSSVSTLKVVLFPLLLVVQVSPSPSLCLSFSMESLANSVFVPNFTEQYPILNNPTSCFRPSNKRIGSLKIGENSTSLRLRAHAVSSEPSGSGETEDGKPLNNGFGLVSDDTVSLSHVNTFALTLLSLFLMYAVISRYSL